MRLVVATSLLFLSLTLLACGSSTPERSPAADYNRPGLQKNYHYAQLKTGLEQVSLRDGSGATFGPEVGLAKHATVCPKQMPRCIRFLGLESPLSPGGRMFFKQHPGNGPSGFILGRDLASPLPDVSPLRRAGNGRPAEDLKNNGKRVVCGFDPTPIPAPLRYPWVRDKNRSSSFKYYGEPYPGVTNLSWSWIDVAGGGVVRTVVPRGQKFYLGAVEEITTKANGGLGWVRVAYGRVRQGKNNFFGWAVTAHNYRGKTVSHLGCKA